MKLEISDRNPEQAFLCEASTTADCHESIVFDTLPWKSTAADFDSPDLAAFLAGCRSSNAWVRTLIQLEVWLKPTVISQKFNADTLQQIIIIHYTVLTNSSDSCKRLLIHSFLLTMTAYRDVPNVCRAGWFIVSSEILDLVSSWSTNQKCFFDKIDQDRKELLCKTKNANVTLAFGFELLMNSKKTIAAVLFGPPQRRIM